MDNLQYNYNNDVLELIFRDRLDIDRVAEIWADCVNLQIKYKPRLLKIEAKNLTYCDSAGIGLITELHKKQEAIAKEFMIANLAANIQQLLDTATETYCPVIVKPQKAKRMTVSLGEFVVQQLYSIKDSIAFTGEACCEIVQTIFKPGRIRWQNFWHAMENVGPGALPIIALIGFLTGLISTFQATVPMGKFGAQIYIINLVGLGLFREMGPLLTAVLLAGRTASAFAAEIGTMKVNQELDALTTMGLKPMRFLTVPWILAATIMTPILSIFFIFFALFGCYLVMNNLGFNLHIFIHQLTSVVHFGDIMGGFIKTFAFGIIVASVGCLNGLKTRFGASAVGYSTTKAVVNSLIMIVLADGAFAAIFYVLRI